MKSRKMLNLLSVIAIAVFMVCILAGCTSNKSSSSTSNSSSKTSSSYSSSNSSSSTSSSTYSSTKQNTTSSKSYSSSSSSSSKSTSSFTNKYGTRTTKCAHAGCNNYIASSGDTNCCTTHSRRCLECKKYIDEDAMYCMDCITKALYGN